MGAQASHSPLEQSAAPTSTMTNSSPDTKRTCLLQFDVTVKVYIPEKFENKLDDEALLDVTKSLVDQGYSTQTAIKNLFATWKDYDRFYMHAAYEPKIPWVKVRLDTN